MLMNPAPGLPTSVNTTPRISRKQALKTGKIDCFMILAMSWAIFNSVPPVLFFCYISFKGRAMRAAVATAQVTSLLMAAVAIASLWLLIPNSYDIKGVMPAVANFLDAQRALGPLPAAAAAEYPWLTLPSVDNDSVPGGFFVDGSTFVKHTFPQAWSTTLLAWSIAEFAKGFDKVGTP